jgi:hypothetical protein
VPQVGLQRAGIVALVRQDKAAGVPQHVRVHGELEFGATFRARCICWGSPLRRYGLGFGLAPARRTVHVGDLR